MSCLVIVQCMHIPEGLHELLNFVRSLSGLSVCVLSLVHNITQDHALRNNAELLEIVNTKSVRIAPQRNAPQRNA